MLTANLLPHQEKKAVTREEWRRVIRILASALLSALIIGVVLLAPSYISLLLQIRELERERTVEEDASRVLELNLARNEADEAAGAIDIVRRAASSRPHTRQLLDAIVRDQPGIAIFSLTIKDAVSVSLEGRAAERNNLLSYEQTLRESGLFAEISSPLSNIIRQTDIMFMLQGTLHQEFAL
jgi:hypothetical protein